MFIAKTIGLSAIKFLLQKQYKEKIKTRRKKDVCQALESMFCIPWLHNCLFYYKVRGMRFDILLCTLTTISSHLKLLKARRKGDGNMVYSRLSKTRRRWTFSVLFTRSLHSLNSIQHSGLNTLTLWNEL